MRSPVTCRFLQESEYDAWQAFVEDSNQGSVYSNPNFLDALSRATGQTFRILAARRGDEIAGGVALYERRVGGGLWAVPRPLLYYNGLLLREHPTKYPSKETARILEVSTSLEAGLSSAGYERIALRNRPSLSDARIFMAKGWNVRPSYTYVVPIADLALAWNRAEQNLRRLVKRCSHEGIQLTNDDDFDSFWRMHVETVERKGLVRYLAEGAFRRLFATLYEQGLCRLYHARLPGGQSISSQLVLMGNHPVSHTVSAAAALDYMKTGATAFLRWRVFESLSALGYEANDLTHASLNSVTHFKSQLGGNLEMSLVFEKPAPPPSFLRRIRSSVAARVRSLGIG